VGSSGALPLLNCQLGKQRTGSTFATYKGSTHYDWFQLSDHELIAAFQQRLNHGQQVFAPSLLAVALQ
jgi:hypothetical protein